MQELATVFQRAATTKGLSVTDLRAFLLYQSAWAGVRLNATERARRSERFLRRLLTPSPV